MKSLLHFLHKYLPKVAIVAVFGAIFSVNTVSAATIINESEVNIGNDKVYEENLYVGAGRTVIEGNVTEDLVVLGGEVIVKGKVDGDIFIVGGQVDFKGEVMGDLRAIGGLIDVFGVVNGDVLAIGGEVNLNQGASTTGEIIIIGGDVDLRNEIVGEIKVIAAEVDVAGILSGKSEITTQNLSLTSNADVSGNLSYYAPYNYTAEDSAVVTGEVSFNEINAIRDTGLVKKAILSFMSFWFLLRFITTLIIATILVYAFKVFTQGSVDITLQSFWKSLLVGVLVFLLTPLIITILFVSLVALPVGFLLGTILTFITIISPAVVGITLGTWAKQYIFKESDGKVDIQGAVIGVVLLTLLQFVPTVGEPLSLILIVATIGTIVRYIRISVVKP